MITLEYIEKYVNQRFDLDVKEKINKRKNVYARTVFSNLALKCIKKMSLSKVGRYIDYDHSSILRYKYKVLDDIKEYEPEYYKIYTDFLNSKKQETYNELKSRCLSLSKKINIYKEENYSVLKQYENIDKQFIDIINSVPQDKLDLFYFRIKPIAKMLNSHSTN